MEVLTAFLESRHGIEFYGDTLVGAVTSYAFGAGATDDDVGLKGRGGAEASAGWWAVEGVAGGVAGYRGGSETDLRDAEDALLLCWWRGGLLHDLRVGERCSCGEQDGDEVHDRG